MAYQYSQIHFNHPRKSSFHSSFVLHPKKQREANRYQHTQMQQESHHSPVCHGWVPTVLLVLPAASHNLCTHQLLLEIPHPTAQRQGYYSATYLHYLPKTPSLVHTSHKIPLHKIYIQNFAIQNSVSKKTIKFHFHPFNFKLLIKM